LALIEELVKVKDTLLLNLKIEEMLRMLMKNFKGTILKDVDYVWIGTLV